MANTLANVADFPILSREIEGKKITYLDSAATSLKPNAVINAVRDFYERGTANIHRGVHTLSRDASEKFENARESVARLINARSREIVFTANTTESINHVAEGLNLGAGDNVITSILDHHSNILPWMKRAQVRFLPLDADGLVDMTKLSELIDAKTRLVALSHVSNVTGGVNDVKTAIDIAHKKGVPVLVDGAQSVPHLPVDVVTLGCDFLAFSAHKMCGPSGIGALFIAEEMWSRMGTSKLGGGTVELVRTDGFDLKRIPHRFEAGTPNIEGALGFGAACDYLDWIGLDKIAAHDNKLSKLMIDKFSAISGLRILGPTKPEKKMAILPFVPRDPVIDFEKVGMILSDTYKIMARTGTHCTHPFFKSLGLNGCIRLSAYIYTSEDDINYAAEATAEVIGKLHGK